MGGQMSNILPVCVGPDPINVSLAIRQLICTNQCNEPQGHTSQSTHLWTNTTTTTTALFRTCKYIDQRSVVNWMNYFTAYFIAAS